MNCGIPFCHNGCPVNNQIPDWNDLVYNGGWQRGVDQPALDQQLPRVHRPRLPRALRGGLHAEHRRHARSPSRRSSAPIVDRAWDEGWITPRCRRRPDRARRSPSSARVLPASPPPSSSPAPATTSMSTRSSPQAGGLLRYGIPDFKMEKRLIDRRVHQMEAEGVTFHYNEHSRRHPPCRGTDGGL